MDAHDAEAASPRVVEIWRLDCGEHRDATAHRFESVLSAPERTRLRSMCNPRARRQFATGRWLLRHILARRLDCAASAVELTFGAHGRPSLATGEFDFNLSHAGSFVVLAVSAARVGIDIESTGRAVSWRSIARRFFSAAETAAIEACAAEEQRAAFFRTWVRKEAFVKALGTGVATGFDRFEVSTGAQPALLDANVDGIDACAWSIRDFEPGPGHVGAVAVRATRSQLLIRDVEP